MSAQFPGLLARFLLNSGPKTMSKRLLSDAGRQRWFSCTSTAAVSSRTYVCHREIFLIQRREFKVASVSAEKRASHSPDEEEEEVEPTGDTPYVVYDGALKKQLRHVKLFSIITSMTGLTMQPVIIKTMDQHGKAATAALLTMVGFFTFVTPVLIHLMSKKYVVEIIFDPTRQEYTAATYNFFLMRKELKFKKEDVIVPEVPGPFTSILIKNKEGNQIPVFVALESFIFPRHYGLFMGYDKPLDLQLTAEDIAAAVDKKRKETRAKS